VSSKKIALIGGSLISSGKLMENVTVLMENGVISSVEAGAVCPEGFEKHDITGKYISAGLIEMHGHFYGRATAEMKSQYTAYCPLYLSGGITTVRTPGEFQPDLTWDIKARIEKGEIIGPSIFSGSNYFDKEPSIVGWMEPSTTEQEIRDKYEIWKNKTDLIKVYSNTPPEWIKILADLAHADGLKVYGHLGTSGAAEAIKAGIDGLEHGFYTMSEFYDQAFSKVRSLALKDFDPDSQAATDVINLIIENDVAITPTTITFILSGKDYTDRLDKDNLWKYLSDDALIHHKARRAEMDSDTENVDLEKILLEKQLRFVNRIYDAGGRIFCGTDPSYPLITPGYAISWEAELLSRCRLSNAYIMEALTIEAAKEIGLQNTIGSLEKGKKADIAVFNKNPLEDIKNLADVFTVYKHGISYDPAALRESAIGKMA